MWRSSGSEVARLPRHPASDRLHDAPCELDDRRRLGSGRRPSPPADLGPSSRGWPRRTTTGSGGRSSAATSSSSRPAGFPRGRPRPPRRRPAAARASHPTRRRGAAATSTGLSHHRLRTNATAASPTPLMSSNSPVSKAPIQRAPIATIPINAAANSAAWGAPRRGSASDCRSAGDGLGMRRADSRLRLADSRL